MASSEVELTITAGTASAVEALNELRDLVGSIQAELRELGETATASMSQVTKALAAQQKMRDSEVETRVEGEDSGE